MNNNMDGIRFLLSALEIQNSSKEKGDLALSQKDYETALSSYQTAMLFSAMPGSKDPNLLANRALAEFKLGCPRRALESLEKVLASDPKHKPSIFLKVRSLWTLHRYDDAWNYVQTIKDKKLKKKQEFIDLHDKAFKMWDLQCRGFFNMSELMEIPKDEFDTVAEYTGPVKIVEIAGKGRALVATEDIKRGQLLICSKAFGILIGDEIPPEDEEGADLNTEAMLKLSNKILAKLRNENEFLDEFKKLLFDKIILHKSFCDKRQNETDQKSEAQAEDSEGQKSTSHICKPKDGEVVCAHGEVDGGAVLGRVSRNRLMGKFAKAAMEQKLPVKMDYCGLWILPSYINHSCVDPTAYRTVFGDIMMIRATRPIKKGEEITMSYVLPEFLPNAAEELDAIMWNHSFQCECRLCKLRRSESEETRKGIREIVKSIEDNLGKLDKKNLVKQFNRFKYLVSLRTGNTDIHIETGNAACRQLLEELYEANEFRMYLEVAEQIRNVQNAQGGCLSAVFKSLCIGVCYKTAFKDKRLGMKWDRLMDEDLEPYFGPAPFNVRLYNQVLFHQVYENCMKEANI